MNVGFSNRRTAICRILAILLFAVLAPVGNLFAQNAQVNAVGGVVRDQSGNPLANVTVSVGDKRTRATTNSKGEFSISALPGDMLQFRMIGYEDVDVEVVGAKTDYAVSMRDSAYIIDDVVVVGYGQYAKKDVTGTVSTVNREELLKSPVVNVDQALQGRMAGVQIVSSDGQPGVDTEIVIRGANSLTQDNSPLYVVDGFPMEDFSLSSIDANDIHSITVLKDASATAIYGSRGANGVVIIETRQGEIGRPKVTYSGTFGVQQVTKKMEMMDAYEYVRYQLDLSPASASLRYLANEQKTHDDYRNVEAIDWQDKLFRTAPVSKHNVTVSGGTNETKYSLSGSYTGQNGVIINSDYEKFQGRASLTQQLYKNLSLKLNMSYTEDKRTGQTSSASLDSSTGYSTYLMYRAWAFRPIVLQNYAYDDETDEEEGEEDLEYAALFDGTVLNPIVSNDNESKTYTRTTFLTNAQLDWSITRNLKVRVLAGINRRGYIAENFYNSLTYNGRKRASNSDGVNSDVRWTNLRNWVNENTITYSKSIGTLHKYDLLGGFTMQGANTTSYGFKTIQIPNENMGMPGMDDGVPQKPVATYKEDALISYLARANYSYKQRYLFTASFRADGSSKFSKSNRWGYFPSGAFAWRFNEERFMMGLPFVDDAKLRVSWGMTGNNRIPENARYPYLTMSDWYSFNNNTPEAAYGLSGLGNDDLRWETTEQTNLGLDLSLLRSRINVTADVYRKTTHDLLLNADIPSTSGVVSVYKNIGRVRNDGLEFSLSTVNVRTKTFQWRSDFNIAFNRSKVLELADSQEYMTSSVTWTGNFNSTPLYITQVGGPLTAFYGFIWEGNYQLDEFNISDSGDYVLKDGIPDNGNDRSEIQPGHIKFRDVTGDGQITDADRVVIGRAEPLHTGGFNNVFRYRNIELTVFMQWSYGQHVMNANRIMFEGNQSGRAVNQFASYADRYDVNDPSTYNSENYAVKGGGPLGFYSSKTLEDASYLRLKTVQLSYDFPKSFTSRLRISGMQIYVSGQNLAVISGYTGLDPEVSTRNTALTPGFDYSSYARNRIYTGGIKITF